MKIQNHLILQEKNEGVIFILNHQIQKLGRVFSLTCIGPPTFLKSFVYKLTMTRSDSYFTIKVKSIPDVLTKLEEYTPAGGYLTVPFTIQNFVLQLSITKAGPLSLWNLKQLHSSS